MLEIEKYPKYNAMGPAYAVSNTFLCPAIYCYKENTVSTLAYNIICYSAIRQGI